MTSHEAELSSRIPTFGSRAEKAEFWETHDFADFQDEFKRVLVRFTKNLSNP